MFGVFRIRLCIISVFLTKATVDSNQFDAHVFPKEGPYFEGWYMRLVDFSKGQSFGLLFGHVLPDGATDTAPLVVASVLYRNACTGSSKCSLTSANAVFNASQMQVTVDGKPVVKDPDDVSPPNFQFQVTSSDENMNNGVFKQANNSTFFNFTVGHLSFIGSLGSPKPWGPNGEGPEGWLDKLPLPLHWFVYSLHSTVISYKMTNRATGHIVKGQSGVAHLEKNWGKKFPTAWIWSQGVASTKKITYALSGGPVKMGIWNVTAFLIGYRNPAIALTLNFRPLDSDVTVNHDGCIGYVNVTATGLFHQMEMVIEAAKESFSECLLAPEKKGFKKACVESYDATTAIVVRKRHGLQWRVVDKQVINKTALEFGGAYVCGQMCG